MRCAPSLLAVGVVWSALAVVSGEAGTAELSVELFASDFNSPVLLLSPPGDTTRIVVVEQPGKIILIKNGTRTVYLDIEDRVGNAGGEQGLLGLAFHPDYAENRLLYVNYTNNNGDTIIDQYKASDTFDKAKRRSRKKILRISQPYSNHNGGMIAFGPNDGYLYIATGDGGDANDPHDNGQRLDTLLGKLLRIDVDSGSPYGIPADNPFVSQTVARPEIWAYGLRNPWRFSFDRETGDVYIGDVGQNDVEEIDFQSGESAGGENYGWRVAEGFDCRGGFGSCGTNPGFTPPIIDYKHFLGTCVIGGYVYRGDDIAGLAGTYFYADHVFGTFWSLRYDGSITEHTNRTSQFDPPGIARISGPSSFGEDASGELYILDRDDGEIYKIVAAG